MKGKLILSLLLTAGLLAGCTGASSYTWTGAALGGGVGALSGAAIDRYNPWRGAAVGGLVGGALGGVAGTAYQQSRTPYQQGYPQGYGPAYGQAYPAAQDPNGQYVQEPQPPAGRNTNRQGTVAQGPTYQHAY